MEPPEPSDAAPESAPARAPRRGLALLRRLLRDVAGLGALFLVASLAVFASVRAIPGDPVSLRLKNPDPARVAAVRAELGLDDPWTTQYARSLSRFVTGDWGRSLASGRPVREELGATLPATLELAGAALALGTVLGVATTLASSGLGNRLGRGLAGALGMLGLTLPVTVTGLAVLGGVAFLAGETGWDWLPTGGRWDWSLGPPPDGTGFLVVDSLAAGSPALAGSALLHLLLPSLALGLYPAAVVAGTLRARLDDPRVETLRRALRARGFGPARVWLLHLLPLLGAPVVTALGTHLGGLVGGAVLTETVFSWPGVGRLLVGGVLNRDVFLVENALLAVILLAAAASMAADLVATALNPSARAGERR